jgi:hypothetical protein
MEIKRDDFCEEFRWSIMCPKCKEYFDTYDDPSYIEDVDCEHCNETFDVVD